MVLSTNSGVYIHSDTMRALSRAPDIFSDTWIPPKRIYPRLIKGLRLLAPNSTTPNALTMVSFVFRRGVITIGSKIVIMPIKVSTADFMVHNIHVFSTHQTVFSILKMFREACAMLRTISPSCNCTQTSVHGDHWILFILATAEWKHGDIPNGVKFG